ncbi:MAG TPA: FtsX-like permease family protein, partial [Gemmatimonadaceae bacterium]|nr:FtsX-like permease family protein [Gemmatimonadaceae bacterium]
DLGFAPERVLTMRLDLTGERYRENPPVFALARALLDRVGGVPGVRRVALEGPGLPTSGWYGAHFTRDGDAGSPPEQYMARRHHVSPGYFAAMSIPLRAGRDFTAADVPEAPRAVVVSEAFARRVWPDAPAVGRRLRSLGPQPTPYTVVGVVGEVEHAGLTTDALRAADIYISVFQSPPRSPAVMNVIARTASARPAELASALRAAIGEAAPGLPPFDVRTMEERLSEQTAGARLLVLLMGAFATLALALAAVGIYGVLAYVVAQRTRELGIRAALGARPGDLVRHVLSQGLRPVLAGVAVGAAGVLALTRLITAMLYGVSPTDPLTLAGVAALLLAVSAAACCVPALRAARVDPQEALREA